MGRQVVVAAYSGEPPAGLVEAARRLVEGLAGCEPRPAVLLGGYRGLMKVVADSAVEAGLQLAFVIPGEYEEDPYPRGSLVVRTGLGPRERSSVLVRSGDALVVLGGGVGTLAEVLLACSYGVPVFYLRGYGLPSDRFAECFAEGSIDPRVGRCIEYFDSVEELLEALCRRLGLRRG
ncbi:hypothetical protein CF15_00245 [Pyrodictium occultum]|uniref:LOG family protein n=1 Tax=Pyrodictium occultum TaxID=2309 RepID=A0A0V8RTR6_PYROC|nr:LOG family protein [Pyrodictium occultum]KSW11338.1 hypothetical protein CF15_00245 [Pyrodictium occultum]